MLRMPQFAGRSHTSDSCLKHLTLLLPQILRSTTTVLCSRYMSKLVKLLLGVASVAGIGIIASTILSPSSAPASNTTPRAETPVAEQPAVDTPAFTFAPARVVPTTQKQAPLSNNNYYTNVDGNKVHSPAYSNTIPENATAQCGDGTYSFSQHRSGTCSHHGGVASWL